MARTAREKKSRARVQRQTNEQKMPALLGIRIRKRFARIGLTHEILELRGHKARPASFD
jgi:hypothetical protein